MDEPKFQLVIDPKICKYHAITYGIPILSENYEIVMKITIAGEHGFKLPQIPTSNMITAL